MKKLAVRSEKLVVATLGALLAVTSVAVADSYVMVYHKDCDHSLHMAVSDDSYNWRAVNGDKPVVDGKEIAEQKGIRDPFIFRSPDGTYLVAATDLHIFAQREGLRETEWERDGKIYDWGNNRGLVFLKSRDLINWEKHNIDFTKLGGKWSEVACVWAPEAVWDEGAGHWLLHFTVRFAGPTPNEIYCAHLNDDLTGLAEEPRPFFSAPRDDKGRSRYNVIDSDIVQADDGTWHFFYVSHERGATVKHATSQNLFGPWEQDESYNDGEKRGHEAPNCWRRASDGKWVVMYDCYGMKPHNFGFSETTDFKTFTRLGYFDQKGGEMKRTGFSEQKHGAVVQVPREDAERLVAHWQGK